LPKLDLATINALKFAHARLWAGASYIMLHEFQSSDVAVIIMAAAVVIVFFAINRSARTKYPPPDEQ